MLLNLSKDPALIPDLPRLVTQNGAVLIKNFSSIYEAHDFLSPNALFPRGGKTWAHIESLPNTVEVSNIPNPVTGRPGWFSNPELDWHTNGVFSSYPETCVALYCDTPSQEGGETELIFGRDLMPQLTEFIEKHKLHGQKLAYRRTSGIDGDGFYRLNEFEKIEFGKHKLRYHPVHAIHHCRLIIKKPLLYRHPVDEALGPYFPFLLLDKASNDASFDILVDGLKSIFLRKPLTVAHRWEKGDLLLMDQVHTLHRRRPFCGQRRLYRIGFWWQSECVEVANSQFEIDPK